MVDENAALCARLRELLTGEGYEVEVATTGAAVRERLEAGLRPPGELPDVVILHVHMRDVSGLQLLADARAANAAVDVVLMVAFSDARVRGAAAQLGARALLWKPFDLEGLRRTVRALERARAAIEDDG